jgi:hypothetical protein
MAHEKGANHRRKPVLETPTIYIYRPRIISVTIYGVQSESLGKRLDLHLLLLYGHDNATDIFRKFLSVIDSPDDQCAPKLEGRERYAGISQSTIDIASVVKQGNVSTEFNILYIIYTAFWT